MPVKQLLLRLTGNHKRLGRKRRDEHDHVQRNGMTSCLMTYPAYAYITTMVGFEFGDTVKSFSSYIPQNFFRNILETLVMVPSGGSPSSVCRVRRPVRRKRVSWEYLWPTIRCRRVAGVSPLLSVGGWYLSSVSPKRHCCRVSAADKGCRVYPLDPRPDAVALYSGCTSEALKLIVPQPSQTYAQITKPTAISTTTQTDPSVTQIICPPLQCLSLISSTSSSTPAVSTSSSSAQTHLLPSTSAEMPTIQSKSLLPVPIPTTTPNNNLNTSASSLETETRPLTTSNKFTSLQPSIPLSESASTTPNSELSNTSKVPQNVKQNSKNRRKRTKAQKAEIEIKMAKHKPRKSGPIEYTTDDEDMMMYDGQAEELEPNPEDKYAMIECFVNNPSEYMRALTLTRFRKSRN
ncbi:uncharacterized protein TNCV_1516851 [Trichonephila clavipes]|nr:uncharacterized protein TNCV_1516851 [Trichonephila clavipes]